MKKTTAKKSASAKYREGRTPLYTCLEHEAAQALDRGKRQHNNNATAAVSHALLATYPPKGTRS